MAWHKQWRLELLTPSPILLHFAGVFLLGQVWLRARAATGKVRLPQFTSQDLKQISPICRWLTAPKQQSSPCSGSCTPSQSPSFISQLALPPGRRSAWGNFHTWCNYEVGIKTLSNKKTSTNPLHAPGLLIIEYCKASVPVEIWPVTGSPNTEKTETWKKCYDRGIHPKIKNKK